MRKVTQTKRVLKALQEAGETGLPSSWFWDNRITRGAARIYDLKQVGYIIETEPDSEGVRYFLKPNEQMSILEQPETVGA